MNRLGTFWGCAVFALVLTGTAGSGVAAAADSGGYNSMDIKSVYYDNAHDRDNAVAMQLAVIRNATSYVDRKSGHRSGLRVNGKAAPRYSDKSLTADMGPHRQ